MALRRPKEPNPILSTWMSTPFDRSAARIGCERSSDDRSTPTTTEVSIPARWAAIQDREADSEGPPKWGSTLGRTRSTLIERQGWSLHRACFSGSTIEAVGVVGLGRRR